MDKAATILKILGRVGEKLIEGLGNGWDNDRIRLEISQVVNDHELDLAKGAAKKVGDFLELLDP